MRTRKEEIYIPSVPLPSEEVSVSLYSHGTDLSSTQYRSTNISRSGCKSKSIHVKFGPNQIAMNLVTSEGVALIDHNTNFSNYPKSYLLTQIFNKDTDQQMQTISTYRPRHFSSGEWSVDLYDNEEMNIRFGSPPIQPSSPTLLNMEKNFFKSLWGDTLQDTIISREERLIQTKDNFQINSLTPIIEITQSNLRSEASGETAESRDSYMASTDDQFYLKDDQRSSKKKVNPRSKSKLAKKKSAKGDFNSASTDTDESEDDLDGDNSSVVSSGTGTGVALFDVKPSKRRNKLNQLAKFVSSHSNRKVVEAWNLIEGRIKNSTFLKTIMVTNQNGLTYPVKQAAISVHTLTSMLCSSRIKLNHKELVSLYTRMGISTEITLLSRKIAALQLTISSHQNTSAFSPMRETYKFNLQQLLEQEDAECLVTLDELMQQVFPEDPEERNQEMEKVYAKRQKEVMDMIEEKRSKDEVRKQSEIRRQKMISDFDDALGDLHVLFGPLSLTKQQAFVELIDYCTRILKELSDDTKTSLTAQKMSFLGYEVFPESVQQFVLRNKKEGPDDSSSVKDVSLSGTSLPPGEPLQVDTMDGEASVETQSRKCTYIPISIHGPPPVVSLLKNMVSFGRGLNGMHYREVVGTLQWLATTKICAMVRCYLKRWVYSAARKMWQRLDIRIQRQHFGAWSTYTRNCIDIRTFCWRKIKAWYYYTKTVMRRRNVFRVCFWPFRVWRKYSDASATAKEKAKFLVGRVMPTYLKLHVFRGWKLYSMKEKALNRIAVQYGLVRIQNRGRLYIRWLKKWAKTRKAIRKAWFRSGNSKMTTKRFLQILYPFALWKAFARFRRIVKENVRINYLPFYHLLMKVGMMENGSVTRSRPPLKLKSNAELRIIKTLRLLEEKKKSKESEREIKRRDRKGKRRGGASSSKPSSSSHHSKASKSSRPNSSSSRPSSSQPNSHVKKNDMDYSSGDFTDSSIGSSYSPTKNPSSSSRGQMKEDLTSDDEAEQPITRARTDSRIQTASVTTPLVSSEEAVEMHDSETLGEKRSSIMDIMSSLQPVTPFRWKQDVSYIYDIMLSTLDEPSDPSSFPHDGVELMIYNDHSDIDAVDHPSEAVATDAVHSVLEEEKELIEDSVDLPHPLLDIYRESAKPLPDMADIDVLNGTIRSRSELFTKMKTLESRFTHADRWVVFEAAMRFHRFAYRAFNNLRVYAKHKRAAKKFCEERVWRTKVVVFEAFRDCWVSGTRRMTVNFVSATDHVKSKMRSFHLSIIARRRKVLKEVKNALGNNFKSVDMDEDVDNAQPDNVLELLKRAATSNRETLALMEAKRAEKARKSAVQSSMVPSTPKKKGVSSGSSGVGGKAGSSGIQRGTSSNSINSKNVVLNHRLSGVKTTSKAASNLNDGDSGNMNDNESSQISMEDASLKLIPTPSNKTSGKASAIHSTKSKKTAAGLPSIPSAGNNAARDGMERVITVYDPPNLLDWDREDREIGETLITTMLQVSKELTGQAQYAVELSDLASHEILENTQKKFSMLHEVLNAETAVTESAAKKQETFASQFKVFVADKMLNILVKIHEEIQDKLEKAETKVYFRALKMPMLLRRTRSMFLRKKMINWIRICRRLISISNRASYYQSRRTMWVTYNRWLKYVESCALDMTPGLRNVVVRRCELYPRFNAKLVKANIQKVVYQSSNRRFRQIISDFESIFLRWCMYTQQRSLFRLLNQKVVQLRYLKTLRLFFFALRNELSRSDTKKIIEENPPSYLITRIECDVELIITRFVSRRRRSIFTVVGRYNRKYIRFLKKYGKTALSFKQFMKEFISENNARVTTEQKLLSEVFDLRGTQEFVDIKIPESALASSSSEDVEVNDESSPHFKVQLPLMMRHIDGVPFSDPHEYSSDGSQVMIPAGYKISRIRFAFQEMGGILGWQVLWNADGMKEVVAQKRGTWNSNSMSVHELLVPSDDFIVGVEYMYDGATIVGIRVKLFRGGFMSWVGARNSSSTLSIYMGAEMAPKQDFEADRDRLLTQDEVNDPALPYSFVIGLTGVVYNNRVSGLGLVVRKVKTQNLFSYHWVKDAVMKDKNASENAALASIFIDADSLPQDIAVPGDKLSLGESLTASKGDDAKEVKKTPSRGNTPNLVGQQRDGNDADDDSYTVDSFDMDNSTLNDEETEMDDESVSSDDNAEETKEDGMSHQMTNQSRKSISHINTSSIAMDGVDNRSKGTVASSLSPVELPVAKKKSSPKNHLTDRGRRTMRRRQQSRHNKYRRHRRKGLANLLPYDYEAIGEAEKDLIPSEIQFFDVLRMRSIELASATERVENFANRLWNNPLFRRDRHLYTLTGIRIVVGLSKWLFNSINKRLVPFPKGDKFGAALMLSSKRLKLRAESLKRRCESEMQIALTLENSIQSWTGKSLLSPYERALKKVHLDKIGQLKELSRRTGMEAVDCLRQSEESYQKGITLVSRLSISRFVYSNYLKKIAAARQKEFLLQRMDMETMKNELFGSSEANLLSSDQMEAIQQSLAKRKPPIQDTNTLERLLDEVFGVESVPRVGSLPSLAIPSKVTMDDNIPPTHRKASYLEHTSSSAVRGEIKTKKRLPEGKGTPSVGTEGLRKHSSLPIVPLIDSFPHHHIHHHHHHASQQGSRRSSKRKMTVRENKSMFARNDNDLLHDAYLHLPQLIQSSPFKHLMEMKERKELGLLPMPRLPGKKLLSQSAKY